MRRCGGFFGISFLYGVFHAVGPGHGKAVISSYLVANEETWRRGVVMSFASAGIQSVVAIVVVAIAAVLLGATAKAIGLTVHLVEIVSYGLVILIGLRLLYVKGRGFLLGCRELTWTQGPVLTLASGHSGNTFPLPAPRLGAMTVRGGQCMVDGGCAGHEHGFHCHDDHHKSAWGHAHGPEPAELAGAGGWRRGLSAVVAVGLRPCSGAIIVLIFALAQDLFWTGVGATLIMGLGTAVTVAAIATLAMSARQIASRVAKTQAGIRHAHDESYRGRRRGAHRRVRHTVVGRLYGERTTLDVHGIEVMGNQLLKILISSIVLVIMTGPASAQDKGSVDPKPLPPLANPNDPHLGTKELFARKILPASLAVHSIGFYAKGCLAGAQALPVNGKTWQVMRLARNRELGPS